MKIRSPNDEQKDAIEHFGGVLLSAGAGSGKTFVLVEHIIYLVKYFFEKEENSLEDEILRKKLREYLSEIALMTFTNKAAGELSIRLQDRIDLEIEYCSHLDKDKWKLVREVLPVLSVGTIHGFCFKLIQKGFFSNISSGETIIGEVEFSAKIDGIFKSWLKQYQFKDDSKKNLLLDNLDQMSDSLCHIFSDPILRISWAEGNLKEILSGDLQSFFTEYLKLSGITQALEDNSIDLSIFKEFEDKKWFQFIKKVSSFLKENPLDSFEDLKNYQLFFSENKGRAPHKNKGFDDAIAYMEVIKKLKSFITDIYDDIDAYESHLEGAFSDWVHLFKSAFDFIENDYLKIAGLTFSDLEYYVYKGLQKEKEQDAIGKIYKYFIIDEFQDTSYVQFSIINNLIKGDYKRLFCVGDVKQAIYGFRGGELGVFKECMEKIPKNISLKNNYRSKGKIINFNNNLFESIFSKGIHFEGNDSFSVEVEHQSIPIEETRDLGEVYHYQVNVIDENDDDKKNKVSNSELNYIESDAIVNIIKKRTLEKEKDDEVICVLFKNLGPTKYLIPRLIKEDLSFTAQIKVPYAEDPILAIYQLLIEAVLADQNKNKTFLSYFQFLLRGILKVLEIKIPSEGIYDKLDRFILDYRYFGENAAFSRFLCSFNIANSNHKNNAEIINSIDLCAGGDLEKTLGLLKKGEQKKYSIDFEYGKNPQNIIIMTTHASKGLEFEHIILGGTHTNGRTRTDYPYFGKMPGSFKWKAADGQKKPFRSPQYILELMIERQKDFSEGKRLFYVAGTRAIETLSWVDIKRNGETLSGAKNSWINGFRLYSDQLQIEENIKEISIESNSSPQDILKITNEDFLLGLSNLPPLFLTDKMGIVERSDFFKTENKSSESSMVVISDLSVTKLASLAECPRKFYLQNICKISEDEISLLFPSPFESKGADLKKEKGLSSNERGSYLHDIIAQTITTNWTIPHDFSNNAPKKDITGVNWIIDILKKECEGKDNLELISEIPLKFPIFNHMISGIPDLIILSENNFSIWDFKTGKSDLLKSVSYHFQLECYAWSQYQLGKVPRNQSVSLVLAYVDEQKLDSYVIDYDSLMLKITSVWDKLTTPEKIDDRFCHHCSFQNICFNETKPCLR